jgi:hypothetical protein
MLIDQYLPTYDINARYQVDIHAPIERVYSAARYLDMSDSWIVRWLYRLRGLPKYNLTLDGMLKWGFVLLADQPSQEIVFGLIGRFWTHSAQIQSVTVDTFVEFQQQGYAKAVGNIAFVPQSVGIVRVTTETRIYCPDDTSRRNFRLYWLLIGSFSGIIRKEWLRLIKQHAEMPLSSTREEARESYTTTK